MDIKNKRIKDKIIVTLFTNLIQLIFKLVQQMIKIIK